MFAFFQSSGTQPSRSDWLKMWVRIGAISVESSLRRWFGISSGPLAFVVTIFDSSLATPASVTVRDGMVGKFGPAVLGVGSPRSVVKTELNWSLRISAFSVLSL